MVNKFPEWLTRPMIKGVYSFNIDAYLLALEGWRRGLTLRWYYDKPKNVDMFLYGINPIGKFFSLSNDEKTHFFYRSRGDLFSTDAIKITLDKMLTKENLIKNNVRTPLGKSFKYLEFHNKGVKYAKEIGYPVVVKPTFGSLGKGVFTSVKNKEELISAAEHIYNEHKYDDILIEQYIQGEEYRVYVVNHEVVACTKKIPANVIGDGKSTIAQLIEHKNELRKNNPHLSKKLITVDKRLINYLKDKNMDLNTVLEEGQYEYIGNVANTSVGGDSLNVSIEDVPESIKTEAVKSLKSLPSAPNAGIDTILSDGQAYIIEINATAAYSQHIFPLYGEPINVSSKIIDYYFPETKSNPKNEKLYFRYKKVSEIIKERYTTFFEMAPAIQNQMYANRFISKGKVQGVGYRDFVRREAARYNIHGYVKNLKNGNVVTIAASEDIDSLNLFKEKLIKGSKRSEVTKVIEYAWEKQVNIGFEIRK